MQIAEAQRDMRDAYLSGAPGMAVSGLVWLIAGFVALNGSGQAAVWALFAGGVAIFPVSVVLCKALGRRGQHARGNPLGTSALEGTGWLIVCLPITFVVSMVNILWFFPAMMLVIGGRYLTFNTLYGLRLYWACGAALALAAYLLAVARAQPFVAAFTGAAIELVFALVILRSSGAGKEA